mgnify:CR=1 FL=1
MRDYGLRCLGEPSVVRKYLRAGMRPSPQKVAARYLRAREWGSQEALDDYLREHPRAIPEKHSVREPAEETTAPSAKSAPDGFTLPDKDVPVKFEMGTIEEYEDDPSEPEGYRLVSSKPLFKSEKAALKHMGLKLPSMDKVAEAMGVDAFPGKVSSEVVTRRWVGKPVLSIVTQGPGIESHVRFVGKDEDGDTYIKNQTFILKPEAHGGGIGTKALYTQVQQARKAGVSYIKTSAGGPPDMNGYYTWPRLGYDGLLSSVNKDEAYEDTSVPEDDPNRWKSRDIPSIEEDIKAAVKKGDLPKGAEKVETVRQLMDLEGGSAWWKKNGRAFSATFDLESDDSVDALEDYIEATAAKLGVSPQEWMDMSPDEIRASKKKSPSPKRVASLFLAAKRRKKKDDEDEEDGKGDQSDLDESDEDILDSVWKKRRDKKRPYKPSRFLKRK